MSQLQVATAILTSPFPILSVLFLAAEVYRLSRG